MPRPATQQRRSVKNVTVPPMFILMLMEDYEGMNGSLTKNEYSEQYKEVKRKLVGIAKK